MIWSLTAKNELTLPDLRSEGDVLLGGANGLLGGHLDCDPRVWDFAVVVSCECTKSTVVSEFWMGVKNALLDLAVRPCRKRNGCEIPGPSPKYLCTLGTHPLANVSSFSSAHQANFFPRSSRTRQLGNVDKPARWLPRMPHPNPFLERMNGIVACHLTKVCRLAWSSHWMLFPASHSNRASLQLDPSRDSPSFLQARNRSGLQTERCVPGCWG